ncbi:Fe-S biogenesis protein NfuA [Candidatus Curculioniphilus buchneri]|uniref:Fe-S biogenesis protein NfuA n=1 Tax=Candidatus Curculioniphilus buchneri TaxID=690594 RepID=UPI00376F3024
MIHITTSAQQHFSNLLVHQEPGTQIRVFAINPGTSNAECGISYCPSNAIEVTDTELKYEKFLVYVDKLSLPYLQDAEIDFITDKLGSQLTLKAPNAKKLNIVNDDAPLIDRIEYFLQSNINPQLESHGGQVKLIELTDDMLAVLQFGGGCNGCAMVDYTLKEVVETKLLETFSELKGICDLTEHKHGEHSYY